MNCHSVVEAPAEGANPVVIYGATGTGKTHLLEGIYAGLRKRHPDVRACLANSEEFTNRFVEAMRSGQSPQEACEAAVRRVNATAVRRGVHPAQVAFLALDPRGRIGAACTVGAKFEYAVGKGDTVELLKAKEIGPEG